MSTLSNIMFDFWKMRQNIEDKRRWSVQEYCLHKKQNVTPEFWSHDYFVVE